MDHYYCYCCYCIGDEDTVVIVAAAAAAVVGDTVGNWVVVVVVAVGEHLIFSVWSHDHDPYSRVVTGVPFLKNHC